MALVDAESCICTRAELELFETKPTQTAIESSRIEEIKPIVSIDQSDSIEFQITTGQDDYLDLRETSLYLRGKIVDEDGEDLAEKDGEALDVTAMVFPVNYFIGSFFQQVEVTLGSQQIGASSSMYAYRAFLEATLTYNNDAKTHQLRTGGYYKDTKEPDKTGTTISDGSSSNKGAVNRFKWTKFSKSFEAEGRIHNEMFLQDKLLLGRVRVSIRLTRHSPKFTLMSEENTANYQIKLEKARLKASIKTIASYVRVAHEERLLEVNAKYPVTRCEMRHFTKSAGLSDLSEANLATGELPRQIVIGLVETEAMTGKLNKNPFNFQHFNVRSLRLRVGGRDIPYGELRMDYANNIFLDGYNTLFRGTKMWMANQSNDISMENYKDGHALYVFNLAPGDSDANSFELVKTGSVSLDISLGEASAVSISIIAYLQYDSFVEIDADRNVYYHEGNKISSG